MQNGVSGSFDGTTLTLNGVGPTIFFSDRPQRVVGHVHTGEFIRHWDKGSDNFAEDHPNATLSVFGETRVDSAVVELISPDLNRNTLSYKVKVLQGQPPKSFGESSLFIDIFGRWRMFARGAAVGALAGSASHAYYAPPVVVAPAPVYTAPVIVEQPAPPPPPAPVNVTVTAPASPPASVPSAQASAVARLKELKSLLNQGLITQSQYQEESQKLLNQIVE